MNKLTERNGQYYINGNLAGYDEVIVFLQEENEQLSEDVNVLENSMVHKYQPRIKELEQENERLNKQLQSWRDACDCGVE